MDTTFREDDGRAYGVSSGVERRKLNWSAIFAGVVATLGLQVLMMYIGAALGISLLDPYQAPQSSDASYALPIIYLLITALASSFFGAWIAGHWANLYQAEDAYMHGALTWALCAVIIAAGLGTALQMGADLAQTGAETAQAAAQMGADQNKQDAAGRFGRALTFNSVDDQRFASFVKNRAQAWAAANPPRNNEEAVNVTADAEVNQRRKPIDPENVADDDDLISFVTANTNMSEDQAKEFLASEKDSIARAQEQSQQRWERAHKRELQAAEKARETASTVAWTWTGLALLSLAASIGGAYLGWRQRYEDVDEDELTDTDVDDTPKTGML
jgi:hypothetical protein